MLTTFCRKLAMRPFDVSTQTVRYRNTYSKKMRTPHFWAKKIQLFTRLMKPEPYDIEFPDFHTCRKSLREELKKFENREENPYERILANEIIEKMNESKMILILHRNALTGEDFYGSIVKFKKEGMTLMMNSRQTVAMAVENTKYVSILRLYESHTLMLCSPEIKLDVVFNQLKKMPYFLLLGGIVENKFLKRDKLEEYSKLTSIDVVRAELVSILNTVPSQLIHNLSQHQMTTVSHLGQYLELKSTSSKVETRNDPLASNKVETPNDLSASNKFETPNDADQSKQDE